MAKRTYGITSGGDRSDYYTPPQGHDKHLSDTERAHSGQAGSKVRHGADATGRLKPNGAINADTGLPVNTNNPEYKAWVKKKLGD